MLLIEKEDWLIPFCSVDELDAFHFHDASIEQIRLEGTRFIWLVDGINAMTTNSQNDHSKDMCTKQATMVFENAAIEKIEFGAYKVYDSNKQLIDSAERRTAKAEEYLDILEKTPGNY